MATKQIVAAPEQYDLNRFLDKFAADSDTILSCLSVLAFEPYAKELYNSYTLNNPNNWSIHVAFDAYRKILSELSKDPKALLDIRYELLPNYIEEHIKALTNTDFTTSLYYYPVSPIAGAYVYNNTPVNGRVELTDAQLRIPTLQHFRIPSVMINGSIDRNTGKPCAPYTAPANCKPGKVPKYAQIQALFPAWVLYHILPADLKAQIFNAQSVGNYPNPDVGLHEFNLTMDTISPIMRKAALKAYTYFNITSQPRYMTFKESYINPDQLSNANLPSDTIYYCIAKDAPLDGLKNRDGSDFIVKNSEKQKTVEFWSALFSDKMFLPVLQGVAALYPTSVRIADSIKATNDFNSIISDVKIKSSFWSKTTTVDYTFHALISQFDITIDSQRRIFVVYTREMKFDTIEFKMTASQWWVDVLTFIVICALIYGGITLLPAAAGGGTGAGFIGPVAPEIISGYTGTTGITGFFESIGTAIGSVLGPIASALPVIAPLLAVFGITPQKKGIGPAPVNNTCPTGYIFQNGQCIADTSKNGGLQLGGLFTGTNLALMAGGGVLLGLLFMGDDDNKAYRAAKKAETTPEIKTNRPKRRYNKRRRK